MNPKTWSWLVFVIVLLALSAIPAPTPAAATAPEYTEFTVNSTADLNDFVINSVCSGGSPTGGPCTLRAAITEANYCDDAPGACGDYVIIHVPAGTYTLTLPGGGEDANTTGDLDISLTNLQITIEGAGASQTIIDGNDIDRVLHIQTNTDVQIRDLTIRGGYLEQVSSSEWKIGAGIYSGNGTLNLENVILENNIVVCSVVPSTSCHQSRGGGLGGNGTIMINTSTIRNNSAYHGGGLFYNGSAELKIFASTISGNQAETAGAFLIYGPTYFANSTISGNSAGDVGGIVISSDTTRLVNVTISGNETISTAANLRNSGTLLLRNTIIAYPKRTSGVASNCSNFSTVTSSGYNMSDDNSCGLAIVTGDFPNTDPKLTPLAWLSGATQTHGLLAQSPAHNAKAGFCTDFDGFTVSIDQRGQNRDAQCDIGAFEGVAYNTYMPVITR